MQIVWESECERDADKGSMHSGQIFTCWVTFCIKLMYNWWKAFIPMSMGTLGLKWMASLVPNDDELDKRIWNYRAQTHFVLQNSDRDAWKKKEKACFSDELGGGDVTFFFLCFSWFLLDPQRSFSLRVLLERQLSSLLQRRGIPALEPGYQ